MSGIRHRSPGEKRLRLPGSQAWSQRLSAALLCAAFQALALTSFGAVSAIYNSSTDVPVTASTFTAAGNTVNFTLNHAPATGTTLTVVNNTGLAFINGTFDNLAQGQAVALGYEGVTYRFFANYYGGTGNDLVLQWADTRMVAWGSNSDGQLGNFPDLRHLRAVATDTTGALAGKTVKMLATGTSYALALCTDGTLVSWGINNSGQLGNGSNRTSYAPVLVTIAGTPLEGKTVTSVAAQFTHSFAVCSDGTVAAWGDNTNGELGTGSTLASNVPVAVTRTGTPLQSRSVVAIAAGYYHTLALCSDGVLLGWGSNRFGQLGNTISTNSTAAAFVNIPNTPLYGKTISSIAAGGYHSLASCTDGTLVAWGDNGSGQLGYAYGTPSGALSGKTVKSVYVGWSDSFALCTDGTLAAWGSNTYGQLGTGNSVSSSVPVAVITAGTPLEGKTISTIAAGEYHTVAVCSDGTTAAWGSNGHGNLGNGGQIDSNIPAAVTITGTALQGKTPVAAAVGRDFSLVRCSDGTVAGWGTQLEGELGDNAPGYLSEPSPVTMAGTVLAGKNIISMATGYIHSLVADSEGTVTGWGFNGLGVLGDGTNTTPVLPVVTSTALVNKRAIRVAGGHLHSLALYSDGTMATWGWDTDGQVGVNRPINSSTDIINVPTPIVTTGVLAGKTAVAIAGGSSFSVALCSDGTLASWGTSNGALGNNDTLGSAVPVLVNRSGVLAGKTVVALATGSAHTLVLCSDGTMATWGANNEGQLGNNSTATKALVPVAVDSSGVLAGKTVTAIAAGQYHNLALCSDGTLVSWGKNTSGQLGNGSTDRSRVPVLVTRAGTPLEGRTIISISAGLGRSFALCSDGTLATWGNPQAGLSSDTSSQSLVPVAVSTAALAPGERITLVSTSQSAYHNLAFVASPPAPAAAPVDGVATLAATSVSTTSATLHGSINAHGISTTASFDFGTSLLFGSSVAGDPSTVTGSSDTEVSAVLTGLAPATTYYYRTVATSGAGTSNAVFKSFTTLSSEARLASVALSSGSLSPAFDSDITQYTVTVPNTVASLTLTPQAVHPFATILVNGVAVASGAASGITALSEGPGNIFTIQVTSQDGSAAQSYVITVTRRALPVVGSPTSASIAVTTATLGGTVSYDGYPPVTARGIVLALTATNGLPQIGGAGVTALAATGNTGTFTVIASSLLGNTDYSFAAYATNSEGTSYSSTATFRTISNNVGIGNLLTSDGFFLSKSFQGSDPNPVSFSGATKSPSIRLTPTLSDPRSTVKINGAPVASGQPSGLLPLTPGSNTINVTVTAEDGVTVRTYPAYITLQLLPSLTAITAANITSDSTTLGGEVTSEGTYPVTARGLVFSQTSTNDHPQINGYGVSKVSASGALGAFTVNLTNLFPGTSYTFAAYATSSIGTSYSAPLSFSTKSYVYTVQCVAPVNVTSTSATLGGNVTSTSSRPIIARGIVLGRNETRGNLTIGAPGVTNLPASDATTGTFSVDALGLTAITGYYYAAYAINSQGTTYSTIRGFMTLNNDADLIGLRVDGGTLTPEFSTTTLDYYASMPGTPKTAIIIPRLNDSGSHAFIDGINVFSNTTSKPLPIGVSGTIITVVVKAQDQAITKTYRIAFNTPWLSVQQSDLVLSSGATYSFGDVEQDKSVSRTFIVKNKGRAALSGISLGLSMNTHTANFSMTKIPAMSVPAGGSTTFAVTFTPGFPGVQSELWRLTSSDSVHPTFDINFTGTGVIMPAIATHPASLLLGANESATFSVNASGGGLTYQWLRNKVAIPGATGSSYTIPAVALAHAGSYSVKVSNAAGSITSQAASLGVVGKGPVHLAVVKSKTITLTSPSAGPGLRWQWYKGLEPLTDGANPANKAGVISGARTSRLMITRCTTDDAAVYTCSVTMADPQQPDIILGPVSSAFAVKITIPPVMDIPDSYFWNWIVGGTVTNVVTAQNDPTSFKVSGLPPGVTLDATGHFRGKPTMAISATTSCRLTITASNAAGTSRPLMLHVTLLPLQTAVTGTFNGLVDRDNVLSSGHGGTLSIASLSNGIFSGKLTLGALSYPFVSQRINSRLTTDASASVVIPRRLPLHSLTLAFNINIDSGELLGTLTDGLIAAPVQVHAWRNPWHATAHPAPLAATYTSALLLDSALEGTATSAANVAYPQGTGYGRLTISPGGTATWSGRMADGVTTTATTTMGPNGDVPLHFMLYGLTGSAHGWVTASADSLMANNGLRLLDGTLTWAKNKQADKSTDHTYKAGFALHTLTVTGGEYRTPASPVLDITDHGAGTVDARLTFSEGGLTGPAPIIPAMMAADPNQSFRITPANTLVMPLAANNPAGLTLTLKAATGLFSGKFVLKNDQDPTASKTSLLSRTVNYCGLLIPRLSVKQGVGYFLLSRLPAPATDTTPRTTLSTSPILSGKVILEEVIPEGL